MLLLIDGMRDSFKIDSGIRDEKQKITALQTLRKELRSNQVGSAYKHSEWGEMAGLNRTEEMEGYGIENTYTPEIWLLISVNSLDKETLLTL